MTVRHVGTRKRYLVAAMRRDAVVRSVSISLWQLMPRSYAVTNAFNAAAYRDTVSGQNTVFARQYALCWMSRCC